MWPVVLININTKDNKYVAIYESVIIIIVITSTSLQ